MQNVMYLPLQYHAESIDCPENPLCSPYASLLSHPQNPWQPLIFSVLPFRECRRVGLIQYVDFSDWPLSLSDRHLKFLLVFPCRDSSFLFIAEWYSIVWVCHSLFIHSPTEDHLGCFRCLVSKTADHSCAGFCADISFQLSWVNT